MRTMVKVVGLLALAVALVLAVFVVLVAAQDGSGGLAEGLGWCAVLVWLASATGVPVAVGWLWSELLEYIQGRWPAFEEMDPREKRVIFGGVCVAVPLATAGLGVATCGWPATWTDTLWPAIVAGLMALGSGTMTHTRHQERKVRILPVERKPKREDRPGW